MKEVYIN